MAWLSLQQLLAKKWVFFLFSVYVCGFQAIKYSGGGEKSYIYFSIINIIREIKADCWVLLFTLLCMISRYDMILWWHCMAWLPSWKMDLVHKNTRRIQSFFLGRRFINVIFFPSCTILWTDEKRRRKKYKGTLLNQVYVHTSCIISCSFYNKSY